MGQKDIKLLWGRSGNKCSICRKTLSLDKNAVNSAYTLGEQAHIVGEKDSAARGRSPLTEQERNSYHNLILLCPTHHREIDENEEDWPVERLHIKKSTHELWVEETLSDVADARKLAKQIAVASIIDSAVELCFLEHWKTWTANALMADPSWPRCLPDDFFEFRQRVTAAIWPPDFDELRRASTTLAVLLHEAGHNFRLHCELRNSMLVPHKFYKAQEFNPNYHADAEEYQLWLEKGWKLLHKATQAANWFADVVRRDINPMFFVEKGKFVILEELANDGAVGVYHSIPEFTEQEKSELPDTLQ